MASIERECAYCAYLDLCTMKDGRFRCERDGEWYFADRDARSLSCWCEIFWSKLDATREAVRKSREYRDKFGCYITTAVCKMLRMPDNCRELRVLKDFRVTVMHENGKYREQLMRYDIFGPLLAKSLLYSGDIDMAMEIFNIYIKPSADLVEAGNYEGAIDLYFNKMFEALVTSKIGFAFIPDAVKTSYDPELGGRGVFSMKPKKVEMSE